MGNWSYNPILIGVTTPFITGRGPACISCMDLLFNGKIKHPLEDTESYSKTKLNPVSLLEQKGSSFARGQNATVYKYNIYIL